MQSITIFSSQKKISAKNNGFGYLPAGSKEMLIISVIHKLFGTIFGNRGNNSET
jgi:hypothetical protein